MLGRILRPILAMAFVALAVWQVRLLIAQVTHKTVVSDMDSVAVTEGPFEVGITREGVLSSASEVTVKVPDRLAWGSSRVTFVVPDGTKVKKGQLIAKMDVSQYRFEVDQQKLQYQEALQRVGQSKRDTQRNVEQADQDLDRTIRSVEMMGKSTSVETEQAQAQVGLDTWNLERAKKDYARELRLQGFGLVPGAEVESAERGVRAQEHSLTAAQKGLVQKELENRIKQAQSATDIDTAKFSATLARRRVKDNARDSERQVKQAKEWLDRLQKDLSNGELRAPKDGMVVLGQSWDESGRHTIRTGDQVYGNICTLTDPYLLQVSLRVSEALIANVRQGQEVVVTAEGVPGRKFRGRVISIGTVAHKVPPWEDISANANERVFDVTVTILDVDPKVLRPGMKAKAKFVFQRLAKARYVPLVSVTHRPGKGEFVYVQRGAVYTERKVETGERNDEAVVVRGGLTLKERVALGDPTKVETER